MPTILTKYLVGIFVDLYYTFSVIIPFKTESAVSLPNVFSIIFAANFIVEAGPFPVIMFPSISTG